RSTMIAFALERIDKNPFMPGMIVCTLRQSIGDAVEDILLISNCCTELEMAKQIVFLPLKPGALKNQ
ncbi:hypothetical protein, partial [Staphylococcus aureus]